MTSILFLAYASSATRPFSRDDLRALLTLARERNSADGITGLLLYRGGNFLQALEGPEEAVRNTYARIERDSRHRGVVHLHEQVVPARVFGEWSMGFEDAATLDAEKLPGVSDFLARAGDTRIIPEDHDAYEFFRTFRELMR